MTDQEVYVPLEEYALGELVHDCDIDWDWAFAEMVEEGYDFFLCCDPNEGACFCEL